MNASLNNSLSDLLEGTDDKVQAFDHDGATIVTKDSMSSPMKKKTVKNKRGSKKKKASKSTVPQEPSHESSLSELLSSPKKGTSKSHENSLSQLLSSPSKSPRRNDCMTVVTMDSMGHKDKQVKRKSKRGGKKKNSSNNNNNNDSKGNLESSLSDLLGDAEDDDYDDAPGQNRLPRESGTVSTLDSMERHRQGGNSGKSPTRRGGKRNVGGDNSLSLFGGPAPTAPPVSLGGALGKLGGRPKDFGRQADDNDTFCGLGTVGESELKKAPLHKTTKATSPLRAKVNRVKAVHAPKPAFTMSNDGDDDSEEEEDLFEGFGANPFRKPTYL